MAIVKPASEKIYVKSYGCTTNFVDGEVINGCLLKKGYRITTEQKEADVLIFNTCAVKSQTENKIIHTLKSISKDKKLIITGCLPLINLERVKKEVRWSGLTGPSPGEGIIDVVERVIKGETTSLIKDNQKPSLSLPRLTTSKIIKSIPICYGCISNCTYCCVHFARGRLRSYSISEVKAAIEDIVREGFKEIWLTGQDLACYGKDLNTNLVELLENIVKLKGDFMIRLGMMNPANVMPLLPNLVDVFKNEKIFKFLHLPIQSGDDKVLKEMNRHYTSQDIKRIIAAFKEGVGTFTLATDIIYGFPTETDTSFTNSLNLLAEIRPDVVNISRFFPRPQTPVANLAPLPISIINNRSQLLYKLSTKISTDKNKEWINWKGPVLVDEKGSPGSWITRNFAYKPIVIKSKENLLGKLVKIQVTAFHSTYLEGLLTFSLLF